MSKTEGPFSPLPKEVWRYDPFFALYLLERKLGPLAHPPGRRQPSPQRKSEIRQEQIRLRPSTSLAQQVTHLQSMSWREASATRPRRAVVEVNFFGLYGAASPLPQWYSQAVVREEQLAREDHGEGVSLDGMVPCRSFLDIFNHRLLTLYYQAWLHNRYHLAYQPRGEDLLSRTLLSCSGVRSRIAAIPSHRLLRYLPLLLLRNRPASALSALLACEFQERLAAEPRCTIRVSQLLPPQRIPLPSEQHARLGKVSLSSHVVMGRSTLNSTGQLGLSIGPLSYDKLSLLIPEADRPASLLQETVALVRLFVRQPLTLVLSIEVPRFMVPQVILGRGADAIRLSRELPPRLVPAARPRLIYVGSPLRADLRHLQMDERQVNTAEDAAELTRGCRSTVLLVVEEQETLQRALLHYPQTRALRLITAPAAAAIPAQERTRYAAALATRIEEALWADCVTFTSRAQVTLEPAGEATRTGDKSTG